MKKRSPTSLYGIVLHWSTQSEPKNQNCERNIDQDSSWGNNLGWTWITCRCWKKEGGWFPSQGPQMQVPVLCHQCVSHLENPFSDCSLTYHTHQMRVPTCLLLPPTSQNPPPPLPPQQPTINDPFNVYPSFCNSLYVPFLNSITPTQHSTINHLLF